MDDGSGLDGIDVGDLDEALEHIAAEHRDDDPAADDVPIQQDYSGPWCAHLKTAIRESDRKLTCRDCGADLDPFDFLLRLARDLNRYSTARHQAAARAKAAEQRLQDLLRDERNTRARLDRLRKKERGTP